MTPRSAKKLVLEHLAANAYLRWRSADKQIEQTSKNYKKGYEFRFPVDTKASAKRLTQALEVLGIYAGRPFPKHRQFIVPVYGCSQVERLIEMSDHWKFV